MLAVHNLRRFLSSSKASPAAFVQINNGIDEVLKTHKRVLGPRAIVVSSLEQSHQNAAGKIWFELQKVGIQSTFLNLKSKYPSTESIRDGVNLVKRTGATSIVTVGNATMTDFGKALQLAADNSIGISSLLRDPTSNRVQISSPRIAHIAVPITSSSNHFLPTCQVIHPEEDILIEIPCFKPSILCFDAQFSVLAALYHHPIISQAQLLTVILDDLMACYLMQSNVDVAKNTAKLVLESSGLKSKLQNAMVQTAESSTVVDALAAAAQFREHMREQFSSTLNAVPEAYPAPLQLAAMLMQTNVTLELSLPFSYHIVTAAGSLLHHRSPSVRHGYVSVSDKKLLAAIDFAVEFIQAKDGLDLGTELLLQKISESMTRIEEIINKKPKLFVAPKIPQKSSQNNPVESLTGAGNLEKVSVFLDFLTEKNEKSTAVFAAKKILLRSDLLLDIMEAMLESDMQ